MRVSSSSSSRRRLAPLVAATVALVALRGAALFAAAPGEDPTSLHLRAVALETELAKRPALYLVLDPANRKIEVRVRGTALTEVHLVEADRLVFSGLFGAGQAPELSAPALWTVVQGPGDIDRETIAPTTLRPYSEEDAVAPTTPAAITALAAKKKLESEKPSSYRVGLDVGWQLYLVNEPPRLDRLRRFGAALRDGWLRMKGEEPSHPPLLALVVTSEDAQRLHHLFRSGMPILVLPGA